MSRKKPRTEADDTAKLKDLMRSELLRILIGRDDDAIDDFVDTVILAIDTKVAHAELRSAGIAAGLVDLRAPGTSELVDVALREGMRELAARGKVPK